MDLNGKIYFFVKDNKDSQGNVWKRFIGSIAKKDAEGHYDSASIDLSFVGACKERAQKLQEGFIYEMNVTKGWVSFRKYLNKDNNNITIFQLVINEFEAISKKTMKVAQEKKEAFEKTMNTIDEISKLNEKKTTVIDEKDLPF